MHSTSRPLFSETPRFHSPSERISNIETLTTIGGIAAIPVIAAATFLALRYKVAGPSQYVVRTGLNIKDISVTKTGLQLPFQKAEFMSIVPITFPIEVDAMSAQRIPFKMPSVWTIGPKNEPEYLENYARLLMDKGTAGLKETVEGVIQGETRVLTANMDLNDLFSDRDQFKDLVVAKINEVIKPLGLVVYNANIAELADLDDKNPYFYDQKQRALQRINQEARVATAEAIKEGETGETEQKGLTRQTVAQIEKDAIIVENARYKDIAESDKDLSVAKAEYKKEIDIAEASARAASNKKELELFIEVEKTRKLQEIERMKAADWAAADVQAEVAVRKAQGESDAIRIKAEAELFAKQREADGILATGKAEAERLELLVNSAGNIDGLNKHLLIKDNALPELAEKQAAALQGLNPKVTVWNTGGNQSALSDTLTDLFKTGMPLFDGIKHQTGYDFLNSMGVKKEEKSLDVGSEKERSNKL